jgi:hypothetical protein
MTPDKPKRDAHHDLKVITLSLAAILGLGLYLWFHQLEAQCNARECPPGSFPHLFRDGCLCVTEPK